MIFEKMEKKVQAALANYRAAVATVENETRLLDVATRNRDAATEAQALTQMVAQELQERAHAQIAGVVSRCLESVFDEPYEFHITFEQKRGRTEAALTFCRDGMEIDPLNASGGGVVDVAAFALRLACLNLSNPEKRLTLIMDEPFKFVSEEYRPRIKELLETLSEEMGVQIIMVTHIPEIKTGKIIEVG